MATSNSSRSKLLLTLALLGATAGWYTWLARAYHEPFHFRADLGGYYNYLTRGFASRSLAVPIDPKQFEMHDMVLYEGRLFLYHGPAPAVVLFLPWRKLTRHDLPEPVAVILLLLVAYAANLASLHKLNPNASLLARASLGLGCSIPFLLHRVWVYEVAIASGLAFSSLTVCAFLYGRQVLTGAMLGLAFLSRPHLLLLGLFLKPNPRLLAGLAPFLIASAAYNYARFGNPFEFGFRYLLSGPGQQTPDFSLAHLLPSLYAFLLHPPALTATSPWCKLTSGFGLWRPQSPFQENSLGALWLAPSLLVTRAWRCPLTFAALALLLFLSTTGWVTQRYLVDFLPLLFLSSLPRETRWATYLMPLGLLTNTAIALLGPNNQP